MPNDDWRDGQDMNVFQMFMIHGGVGFWVRRTTWENACARVVRVGEMTAPPPYFGNPSVLVDVYTLNGQIKELTAELPAAGTYKTWRMIEPPNWAAAANLPPLDDPSLDEALSRLDKKRHKSALRSQGEKLLLRVPFERKDEAKTIGARWSQADKAWWLPTGDIVAIAKARELGFVI